MKTALAQTNMNETQRVFRIIILHFIYVSKHSDHPYLLTAPPLLTQLQQFHVKLTLLYNLLF